MPTVLIIGNFDSLQNQRTMILNELLHFFPGNLSFQETRRGEIGGFYWILPDQYRELPPENLRERVLSLREKLSTNRFDVLFLKQLLKGGNAFDNYLNEESSPDSLFVFDMDSTIIQEEVIDELARKNGLYEKVAQVTKSAMEGGLGFEEALRKRVVYLKDLPETVFDDIYPILNPNPGVVRALAELKSEYQSRIAILSGGFTPFLERFSLEHGIDYYEANVLEVKDGKITGNLLGRIVDKERKKSALIELQEKWNIPNEQVVAVGDGANDSLMLNSAGLGIGFHAKDGLKEKVLNWIEFNSMEALLLLFAPSL